MARIKREQEESSLFFPESALADEDNEVNDNEVNGNEANGNEANDNEVNGNEANDNAVDDNTAMDDDNGASDNGVHHEDIYEDDSEDEDAATEFIVNEQLPTPITAQRKISYLLELLDQNLIELNPSYQRDVVWTLDRQIGLINSLNENFYIPPIIFNVEDHIVGENAKKIRTCVDGKQRLSSISRFVKGLVPCRDKDGYRWWWSRVGGRSRKLLPANFKQRFLAKELFCVEYNDLSAKQQEDLFGRVQKGMVLTEAEKLKAQKGPWQDLALDIEQDFKEIISLAANKRASGFRNILTTMAQIMELRTVDTKMDGSSDTPALQANGPSLKKFVANEGDKCTIEAINLMAWIFRLWNKVRVLDPAVFENNGYNSAKKFAPLEFLAVGVLLFKHGSNRELQMLKGDIAGLRLHLRVCHHDLLINPKCWSSCWEYVDNLERYRGDTQERAHHDIAPVLTRNGQSTSRFQHEARRSGELPLKAILARAKQRREARKRADAPEAAPMGVRKSKEKGKSMCSDATDVAIRYKKASPNSSSKGAEASSTSNPTSPSLNANESSNSEGLLRSTRRNCASREVNTTSIGTSATDTKRKRVIVKTADGASQLLFKRKKGE
ncbi:MAG: hypothetical protein M1839_006875 [Geoglossum umbratile]|nr:MAG: hypothetical protein M1839_006875 [Geoglossum umbratile]